VFIVYTKLRRVMKRPFEQRVRAARRTTLDERLDPNQHAQPDCDAYVT
jgi:hypothetical protein